MKKTIKAHLEEAAKALEAFSCHGENITAIEKAGEILSNSLKSGGKILSCGNGGSMCDAMHFAEELSGRFRENRKPLAAIALSDVAHMSCVANDYGFDEVFARSVQALGQKGDVLLAISTSGNSPNIIRAVEEAKKNKMTVIALTGKDGGKLSAMADLEIRAPKSPFSDRVQEIHIKVIHILIDLIEQSVV